jgi:hypothetical protein
VANDDPAHVALPKLYGAPAYARPPITPVEPVDRPFDPDELPLEAVQTDEERALAQHLAGRPFAGLASSEPAAASGNGQQHLRGRTFRIRAFADRIRDPRGDAEV